MALPAGMIMRKYGYKSGIIIGLILFALGSFLFVPAANTQEYGFFLGALFIIACGLTILETAANPYVTILGPQESSTQRLNFAQSFNGLAVTIAPIIGGLFILSPLNEDELKSKLASMSDTAKIAYLESEAASVKMPYIVLGSIILIVALLFIFTKLPDIKEEAVENKNILHALRHRHLTWAVIAQFFYVGAQVCVQSFFILFAIDVAGLTKTEASWYLGLGYGIAFVSGRFIGTFLMRYIEPAKLLSFFAAASIVLSLIAINTTGMTALYAVIGTSFFMSIMFPTIFALGIKGLGADTKIGSSLIIMAIVGGAVLPLVLGYIADQTNDIQYGYYVPVICFVVVLYFGIKGYKPEKNYEQEILPGT